MFSTCFNVTSGMNPDDFDDPLTFLLVSPADQSFNFSSEMSQHLLDGLAQNMAATFMGPTG